MKDNKLISTVIPTFNRKLYLKKAIESCLDQTINHEIIVCNHGGSDGTDEMVQQFHGKIKYIKKKIDNGPHYCWLDGVMEARGEFINLLFDDDWIEPNYIEECMKHFDVPKVGFVFTLAKLYNDKHQKVESIQHNDYLFKDGIYKISKYETNLLKALISPTAFIMRKKDMIDSLYSGKLPLAKYSYKGVGPDRFMILLCMLRYSSFGFVNKPLANYRIHNNSITIDSLLDENKRILVEKAYNEVDKYYYTIKYGKFFSFLHNYCIFKIRFILNNPRTVFKKLIRKLSRKLNDIKK
jgi:glycosyltransferase involved in cell wall biosynthesis